MSGTTPKCSMARKARLHLVGDEERAVVFEDFLHALEITLGRDDDARVALDALGDECGGMPGRYVLDGVLKGVRAVEPAGFRRFSVRTAVAVRIRHEVDAADGIRVGAPHGDAREAHGELRPSVQSAAQGDEFAAARVNLREERRALVRLGAGGAEEALLQIAGGDARELLGEVDEVLREVDVADVL